MKKLFIAFALLINVISYSQEIDSAQLYYAYAYDSMVNSLVYQTGVIELESGNATLAVPDGFRFLNKEHSRTVLSGLWGNPENNAVIGLLVPTNKNVEDEDSWVLSISFDEMGYVKDDDADDINYDDLLKEQQKETNDANPERVAQGYQPIQFIGWASKPFYDQDKKILHWAKELKFGEDSLHTLNYNLRVLGRKGVMIINAIATMDALPEVKSNIDKVIASVQFKEGHKYENFDSNIDEVAAWTVGGLVAGKVLAKVGFFAVIAKFGKVIFIGIAAAGAALWKFFRGRRREDDFPVKNSGTDSTQAS